MNSVVVVVGAITITLVLFGVIGFCYFLTARLLDGFRSGIESLTSGLSDLASTTMETAARTILAPNLTPTDDNHTPNPPDIDYYGLPDEYARSGDPTEPDLPDYEINGNPRVLPVGHFDIDELPPEWVTGG